MVALLALVPYTRRALDGANCSYQTAALANPVKALISTGVLYKMRAPDCARLQDVQPTRTSEQVCRRFDADASCCTMHRSGRRRCVYQHGNGTCMLSPEHDKAGYCSYQPCQCPSCIECVSRLLTRAPLALLALIEPDTALG